MQLFPAPSEKEHTRKDNTTISFFFKSPEPSLNHLRDMGALLSSCFGDDVSRTRSSEDQPFHPSRIVSEKIMPSGDKMTAPEVLVPLYIYPAPEAWLPLYHAIQAFPSVRFTVIINPGNGPGPGPLPDANYLAEIPKLASFANVRLLGYVHTTWTKRSLAEVQRDVLTYAEWSHHSSTRASGGSEYPSVSVTGIFVDETPNQADHDSEEYLRALTEYIKGCEGLGDDRTVIHNPGCIPSPGYVALADQTVVFEDTYYVFLSRVSELMFNKNNIIAADAGHGPEDPDHGPDHHAAAAAHFLTDRNKLAIMIHSIPASLSPVDLQNLINQVQRIAGTAFLTDLNEEYYAKFGGGLMKWIDAFAASPSSC